MAKMLDVLEAFLNLHGHVYMRLDGSTKPEARQVSRGRAAAGVRVEAWQALRTQAGALSLPAP